MIRRQISRMIGVSALSVFVAGATSGQEQYKVMVKLTGPVAVTGCSSVPRDFGLVIDDQDGRDDRLPLTRVSGCLWTGGPFPFNPGRSHFSLRLGIARTDCEKATLLDHVAWMAFECCQAPSAQEVKVHADLPFAVSYVRQVPPFPRGAASTRCVENSALPAGDGFLDDVEFRKEVVRLQLGRRHARQEDPGLRVNWLSAAELQGDGMTLDTVVDALARQRAYGDVSSPTLSSDAIDLDRKTLKEFRLRKLVVRELPSRR
jgi:hypothetical protein